MGCACARHGRTPSDPLQRARLYTDVTAQPATTTSTIESLLDADQVAERLGVEPRFVRRLVEERRIPFCKLGKFVRFRPSDIDEWLGNCTVDRVDHCLGAVG